MEITAKEAWEAVERLRLDVSFNNILSQWCVVWPQSVKFDSGWGDTPVEAVAQLLVRIGETATKVEVASV